MGWRFGGPGWHGPRKPQDPMSLQLPGAGLCPHPYATHLHPLTCAATTPCPRQVHDIVRDVFKKEPNRSMNPDEVVAMGAAIQVREGVRLRQVCSNSLHAAGRSWPSVPELPFR